MPVIQVVLCFYLSFAARAALSRDCPCKIPTGLLVPDGIEDSILIMFLDFGKFDVKPLPECGNALEFPAKALSVEKSKMMCLDTA